MEAFVLLALAAAGQAEPSYYEEFISRKAELSRETRAILTLRCIGPPDLLGETAKVTSTAIDRE